MKPLLLLTTAFLFNISLFSQESCNMAAPVTTGIYSMTGFTGTDAPDISCFPNMDQCAWYTYTTVVDAYTTVTTNLGENVGLDTRLQVLTGSCGATSCLGGDDDSGTGFLSTYSWNALAGITYYIVFDDYWDASPFSFSIAETEPAEELVSFTPTTIEAAGSTLAVVDMNGDFLDDIVSVNGDILNLNYQQEDGTFEMVNKSTGPVTYDPGWSLAAGDLDNNGFTDLVYAGSGASFIWASDDGSAYSETHDDNYIFCQRSNMVDLDADGNLDVFVCHDVEPNVHFINEGDQVMTYFQGGMGETPDGGNYGSVFIDYDNDCDMDMFIAKCRGGVSLAKYNQLHRNNGDGTFTEVSEESNLWDPLQTWSSVWADFDNDGFMDVMVCASSFSDGVHKLMHNNGDGTFTDVTAGSGLESQTGASIENIQADFNNDGWVDVLGLGNTIMINNGDMTFSPNNTSYDYGPIGDLNNDGFIDIANSGWNNQVTVNLNAGNENNWLIVNTIGTLSNKSGIGARLTLHSAMGQQIRDVRSGQGFRYMQSLNTHFGIGEDTEIDYITVCWPSGIVDEVQAPAINTVLTIVEGSTSNIVDAETTVLSVYPNPAGDRIFIDAPGFTSQEICIYHLSGKMVICTKVQNSSVDIAVLSPGFYTIRTMVNGVEKQAKFTKE